MSAHLLETILGAVMVSGGVLGFAYGLIAALWGKR